MNGEQTSNINGKGAFGYVPLAKQSFQNLLSELTYIIQTNKPNKLRYGNETEIDKLSYYSNLKRFVEKAKQQPSLLFENNPDIVSTASNDITVKIAEEIAGEYESIASHNLFILLVSVGLLGMLITVYKKDLLNL